MNKQWNKFLFEADQNDEIDLPLVEIKDSLNMNVWQSEDRIKPEISSRLIQIALDFLGSIQIPHEIVSDIVLTGSLANYNWTEYSDIDLHILLNFEDVDENVKLVGDFFNAKKSDWNKMHQIYIKDHEVEIYVQDISEPHISTGVYSLLEDQWNVKPNKFVPKIDYKSVETKARSLIDQITRLEEMYKNNNHEAVQNVGALIKDKIKRLRRCGLANKGVHSIENLAFKTLRNGGYIKKLFDLKRTSYDKMMSLNHNAV